MLAINSLASKIDGITTRVIAKAQEYHRLCAIRMPHASSLTLTSARPALCLELASRVIQASSTSSSQGGNSSSASSSISRLAFQKSSGLSRGKYEAAMRHLMNVLSISLSASSVTLQELCIKVGKTTLLVPAVAVWQHYKSVVPATLRTVQKAAIDLERPEFKVAALFLCTKIREKTPMDVGPMLEGLNVTKKEFHQIVTSMEHHCAAVIQGTMRPALLPLAKPHGIENKKRPREKMSTPCPPKPRPPLASLASTTAPKRTPSTPACPYRTSKKPKALASIMSLIATQQSQQLATSSRPPLRPPLRSTAGQALEVFSTASSPCPSLNVSNEAVCDTTSRSVTPRVTAVVLTAQEEYDAWKASVVKKMATSS